MALSSQDAAVLQWLARQLCEYHVKGFKEDVKMCRTGLHASLHPLDAPKFAPRPTLCKVEVRGEILYVKG